MISNQTFDNYPEFANSGTKSKPNDVKYAAGFVPSDVLPAEWLNWFLNGATKGVTALNTGVAELEKELNNILAQVSASADPSQHDQVVTAIINLIENRTGLLSNLTTTEKSNIVASINELVSTIAGNGSAAGKDAGSAAGDVPLLSGAITSSAENTPIVADGSGELKPHASGALGTAAFKPAGNEAGQLPQNSSSLSSPTNGIICVDSIGLYNSGLSTAELVKGGNTGAICATAAGTSVKEVIIPGFHFYHGVRVTVLFINACTTNAVTLKVNGQGGYIYRRIGTQLKAITGISAKWRNSNTAFTEIWQPYTSLTFIYYTGYGWIIEGNPVLESYYSTTNSYVVYADGRIEQWGHSSESTGSSYTLTYLVPFTNATSYSISANDVYDSGTVNNVQCYDKLNKQCSVHRDSRASSNWDWRALGY